MPDSSLCTQGPNSPGPLAVPDGDPRILPRPPRHPFRFRVWEGWKERSPGQLELVISLGLLSERKSG